MSIWWCPTTWPVVYINEEKSVICHWAVWQIRLWWRNFSEIACLVRCDVTWNNNTRYPVFPVLCKVHRPLVSTSGLFVKEQDLSKHTLAVFTQEHKMSKSVWYRDSEISIGMKLWPWSWCQRSVTQSWSVEVDNKISWWICVLQRFKISYSLKL